MVTTRSGKTYTSSTTYVKRRGRKRVSTAVKALKAVRALRRVVDPEMKFYFYNTTLTPSSTAAAYDLLAPAQGDTYITRDGDQIRAHSMYGKFLIWTNASSVGFTVVRIAITYCNYDSTVNYADVFNTAGSTAPDWIVNRNVNNPTVTVLYDKIIILNPNITGVSVSRLINFRRKLNKKVLFDAGATTATKGFIQLHIISNQVTNTPSVAVELNTKYSG